MPKKLFLVLASLLLLACSPPVKKPAPLSELQLASEMQTPYIIGVGDELDIKFYFLPKLNDKVTVRPDGRISIMFANDIEAAGKTVEQLTDDVKDALAPHVKPLDMLISVTGFASRRVYVGGEVQKPAPVVLTGNFNVMQTLGEAGWITPAASLEEVILIRNDSNHKDHIYHLNLTKALSGEDTSQNVQVMAGDIILVPPSNMIAFDRWLDQHVTQAVPFRMGASYNYNHNALGTVP